MARSTVSPARRPTSALGRIPAAITSMSQASVEPSLNARPVTQSSPITAAVLFSRWTVTPNFSMLDFRMAPAGASSGMFIRCFPVWTTCTSQSWVIRPRAASRPSRPPPMTAARELCFARASGRNQKPVVSLSDSGFGSDDFGGQVDFDDRRARVKDDVVLTVPIERVDENLAGLLRAAQDAGEQDPVVVPIGFVAEHHNVELITAATKQDFFHGALARHAVADNHKGEFSHISTPHFVQS